MFCRSNPSDFVVTRGVKVKMSNERDSEDFNTILEVRKWEPIETLRKKEGKSE